MNEKAIPTHLYHYTTDLGLKGIVDSQELWATDTSCLNDTAELWRGRNILSCALEKRLASGQVDTEQRGIAQEILNLLKTPKTPDDMPPVFVSSFTDIDDSHDHWTKFCQPYGYSIGFPYARLFSLQLGERSIDPKHRECSRNNFLLKVCRYNSDCDDYCGLLFSSCHRIIQAEGKLPFIRVAKLLLCNIAAVYKGPTFSNECEWRLIHVSSRPKATSRVHGRSPLSYVRFCIHDPELWKGIRIVVSPDRPDTNKRRVESIKAFLHSQLTKHGLPTSCVQHVRSS